jgi:hypothetical protein
MHDIQEPSGQAQSPTSVRLGHYPFEVERPDAQSPASARLSNYAWEVERPDAQSPTSARASSSLPQESREYSPQSFTAHVQREIQRQKALIAEEERIQEELGLTLEEQEREGVRRVGVWRDGVAKAAEKKS